MHLLIPHASAMSDASVHTLRDLTLPNLGRLISVLQASPPDIEDEYTLSPPHERALARAHGWQGGDGRWPWVRCRPLQTASIPAPSPAAC